MRSLRLVALSEDGTHLVLAAEGPDPSDDVEHLELAVDEHLRSLLAGRPAEPTAEPAPQPVPAQPANDLPPRVIQARIRAGESPEQVAHASGTRVERIMRFAHPVLQERTRVAEQARDARVRLSEGTPSVPLEQFMSERLRLLGADLDAVRWDAHRSEDGTWQVRAAWRAGHKSGTTRWSYDIPARTVTPVDATTMDFAEGTRLVRVVPDVPVGLPAAPISRRSIAMVTGADGHGGEGRGDEEPGLLDRSDDEVRNVVPADGNPVDVLLSGDDGPYGEARPAHGGQSARSPYDEADTQDTVVLGSLGDGETDDPRARIPAWEDIVFGVRRHR
ncbi:septation protein SepH [Modestobacter altitudinis]|uniref:septation protein SepH n=1 Tax=Modestobacter altitudinis TaxID=2213158 RepID=UPI00110C9A07|nr:septation protein SepH [Modestobacter altitudinis]